MTGKNFGVLKRTQKNQRNTRDNYNKKLIQYNKRTIRNKTRKQPEFLLTKSLFIFSIKPPLETEYEKSTIALSKKEICNSGFSLCEHKKIFTV